MSGSLIEVTSRLLDANEEWLLISLGEISTAIQADPTVASDYTAAIGSILATKFEINEKRDSESSLLGYKIFRAIERAAYSVLCVDEEKDDLGNIARQLHIDAASAAATLTGVLTASLGIAPSIAVLISCLLIRTVFRPAKTEVCKF